MSAGRPPLFETPEDLQSKIDAYYESCQDKEMPADEDHLEGWQYYGEHPTITGLAYFLGFESRQSFYDYEEREEFSYTIKRARLRIESNYEQALFGKNQAGPIFALKNFGWKDTQEIKHDLPRAFLSIDPLADDTTHDSAKENSEA